MRVQRSLFERIEDRFFLNWNPCFNQAIDRFLRQTVM